MALQTVRARNWPGMIDTITGSVAIAADVAMTSAGHYTCPVMQAPEDMTITHMGFYAFAATGNPTLDSRIESIDLATGLPNGLWAAGTNKVSAGALVANTWNLEQLTAPAVILRGQFFGAKFAMASGTTLTSAKISGFGGVSLLPFRANNTGSPAKAVTVAQLLALGDSATTFLPFDQLWPITAWTANTFNNTNAAKRGIRFQVPYKCRATGVRIVQGLAGDYNVLIMDDAGVDLGSTSKAVDKDLFMASNGWSNVFFTNPAVLLPGIWYRIAIEPTSATNCQAVTMTLPTANYRSAMPGGTNYTYTAFTTGGGWDDAQTTLVMAMDLIINQFADDVGGGGGMKVHPGMAGGMRG